MNLKLLLSSTLLTTVALNAACSDPADPGVEPAPDAAVPAPALLEVSVSLTKLPILQGNSATIDVTVVRHPGVDGAITIEPIGLPAGVVAEPLVIGAGSTSGALVLRTETTSPHSLPTTVVVKATAEGAVASTEMTVTVYGPPGSLDTSFGGGKLMIPAGIGDDYANALAVQADGKLVIAGRGAEHLGDFALIRLDRDGELDPTFGTGGRVLTDFAGASETINAIAIQPDGKIVVAGTTAGSGTSNDFAVARYLTDGTLDPSFGTGGKVVTALGSDSDTAYALLIQPDGKIVVGGDSNRGSSSSGLDFALVRYTAAGALDPTFDTDGIVLTPIAANGGRDSIYALALHEVDGEQRIVAAGGEGDFTVARYRPDGALDVSFDTDGKAHNLFGSTIGAARAVTITSSGAIVLAGHSHHDFALAQLTMDGDLDGLFGTGGKVLTQVTTTNWDEAQAIAVDTAGKLLVAGWAYEGNSSAGNFVVARYLTNGTLDPQFAGTGIVLTPVAAGSKADQAMAVAIQQDDRVPTHRVITAGFASVTNSDFAVTRYWR